MGTGAAQGSASAFAMLCGSGSTIRRSCGRAVVSTRFEQLVLSGSAQVQIIAGSRIAQDRDSDPIAPPV